MDCRIVDHWSALGEFFLNVIFSTAPIWLGGLFIFIDTSVDNRRIWESVILTINNGELFMFSTAMVAPILYMAVKTEKGMPTFPGQLSHISLIVIVGLACSGLFAAARVGKPDPVLILNISILLYSVSLLLLYLAMVYKNNRFMGALSIDRKQTKDFVDEFNEKHK